MKPLVVAAVVLSIVAISMVVFGGPLVLDSEVAESGFGIGSIPQVRPERINIRVTNSQADEIPSTSKILEIYNGRASDVTFNISYEQPWDSWPGYQGAPEAAKDWVRFNPSRITVRSGQIGVVEVTLKIPTRVVDYDWEFWVAVDEMTGGNVRTTVFIRWLIEMR